MKITKQQLKQIIEEEVANLAEEDVELEPEAEPVRGPIGFKESLARIVKEEVSKVLKEDRETDPIGRAQQRLARPSFTGWVAQVKKLGFVFRENSPNAYDAWLQGSTPQQYVKQGGIELKEEKAKNNPWANCTAEVGREDKEKYERCVKSVKKGD